MAGQSGILYIHPFSLHISTVLPPLSLSLLSLFCQLSYFTHFIGQHSTIQLHVLLLLKWKLSDLNNCGVLISNFELRKFHVRGHLRTILSFLFNKLSILTN